MNNKGSLTSLRFFAAYMVVGFHYFNFYDPLDFLNSIFIRGSLGVQFFFILSGFVLGLRYYDEIVWNQFDPPKFLLNRITRIVPAYYLSLIFSSVLLYRALGTSEFLADNFNVALFVGANLSFLQSYIPVDSLIENWNLPSWSLSVEMFFYLLFPFFSVRILKYPRANQLLAGLFLLTILVYTAHHLLPSTITFLGTETRIMWINCAPLRLPHFLIGILLAKKYLNNETKHNPEILLWISIIGTCLLFILPLPTYIIEACSVFVFSSLIYSCAACDTGKGLLNNKILKLLGEASYSLYIFQVPLKVFFQQIFSKVFHLGETTGLVYCLYLSITLILSSVVLHLYFEVPVHRFLRNKLAEKRNVA